MEMKLQGQPESVREAIRYGIQGQKLIFIPFTGWGNTATVILYLGGDAVNCPVPRKDWQFGGTLDRHPDGPVFETLSSALAEYPFEVTHYLEPIPDPSAIGGLVHR